MYLSEKQHKRCLVWWGVLRRRDTWNLTSLCMRTHQTKRDDIRTPECRFTNELMSSMTWAVVAPPRFNIGDIFTCRCALLLNVRLLCAHLFQIMWLRSSSWGGFFSFLALSTRRRDQDVSSKSSTGCEPPTRQLLVKFDGYVMTGRLMVGKCAYSPFRRLNLLCLVTLTSFGTIAMLLTRILSSHTLYSLSHKCWIGQRALNCLDATYARFPSKSFRPLDVSRFKKAYLHPLTSKYFSPSWRRSYWPWHQARIHWIPQSQYRLWLCTGYWWRFQVEGVRYTCTMDLVCLIHF